MGRELTYLEELVTTSERNINQLKKEVLELRKELLELKDEMEARKKFEGHGKRRSLSCLGIL